MAGSRKRAAACLEKKVGGPRTTDVDEKVAEEVEQNSEASGSHQKYCHFCQHVKVRSASMLACENEECSRRFCQHCLLVHIQEDMDPASSNSWTVIDGKARWSCPICRSACCCSLNECTAKHRHCKAYRYRRRRAELALKRSGSIAVIAKKATTKKQVTQTTAATTATTQFAREDKQSEDNQTHPLQPGAFAPADSCRDAGNAHGVKEVTPTAQRLCPALSDLGYDEAADNYEIMGEAPMWGHEMSEMAESHAQEITSVSASSEDTAWLSDDPSEKYELGWPAQDKQEEPPLFLEDGATHESDPKNDAENFEITTDLDWLWSSYEAAAPPKASPAAREKLLDQLVNNRSAGKRLCGPGPGVPANKPPFRSTVMYEWA